MLGGENRMAAVCRSVWLFVSLSKKIQMYHSKDLALAFGFMDIYVQSSISVRSGLNCVTKTYIHIRMYVLVHTVTI